jgi:hypothetical protein
MNFYLKCIFEVALPQTRRSEAENGDIAEIRKKK